MKKSTFLLATIATCILILFGSQALAVERTVDCEKGQSLQDALDKGRGSAQSLEIVFSGSCTENVTIRRDNVHIYGDGDAELIGEIQVQGGHRIEFTAFKVTGAGNGIIANTNSSVTLNQMRVVGNHGLMGAGSNVGSHMRIFDSIISDNLNWGVNVTNAATLEIDHSNVIDNTNINARADAGSTLYVLNGSKINGSTCNGMQVTLQSNAWIQDSEINGNACSGIFVQYDSGVRFNFGVTVSGNAGAGVYCEDLESSFVNNGAPISNPVICTGFN
jgi:hypothetical protein